MKAQTLFSASCCAGTFHLRVAQIQQRTLASSRCKPLSAVSDVHHNFVSAGLQEVDVKLYEEYYSAFFAAEGYAGVYSNKEGKVAEGCSLFVRNDR